MDNGDPHIAALGLPADAKATDTTSAWSVVALLKAILGQLRRIQGVNG